MSERPSVLIVDDDPDFLAYLRDRLVSVDAVVAHTPLEAMWHLERRRFCAVLCDLVLGSVDGRNLLDVVEQRWPATSRILVTGYGDKLAGCTSADLLPATEAIVLKPCDVGALDELLRELPSADVA